MSDERRERALSACYLVLVAIWGIVYLVRFGPAIFLWFCCASNVVLAIGLARDSRLLVSMSAVAVLPVQLLFVLDLLAAILFHVHPFGGTEYLFEPARPPWLAVLALHHVVAPLFALRFLRHRGYEPRALARQTVLGATLLVAGYVFVDPTTTTDDVAMPIVDGVAFDRDYDVNWAHGLRGRPPDGNGLPAWLIMLFGYPLAVHLPTHVALRRFLPGRVST